MREAASHASLPGIKVQIVDPPAWTPPYDHALSSALAKAGADVELVTTEFPLGSVPEHGEYRLSKRFYRQSARLYGTNGERRAQAALRRGIKLAEHVPDLLLYRRHAGDADVVHYQWLTFPALDVHLLPPARPRVFTAHNVPPREPRRGDVAAFKRLLRKMDAIVVHSAHGARRLSEELDAPPERVHVIPHGAFDYLTRLPFERPLPAELAAVEGPVILFFGLLRSYKGLDVLLDAFSDIEGAELWIVGLPTSRLRSSRSARAAHGAGSASCLVSWPRTRFPRSSSGPTWSRCRTARSTSPVCCRRHWPSASRLCCRT